MDVSRLDLLEHEESRWAPRRESARRAKRDGARSDVSDRKRRANELMRSGLGHFDPAEPVPYFCECGWERCYKPVWLTHEEYDARRPNPHWLAIAPDHAADATISRAATSH